jgi:hypothetical protein
VTVNTDMHPSTITSCTKREVALERELEAAPTLASNTRTAMLKRSATLRLLVYTCPGHTLDKPIAQLLQGHPRSTNALLQDIRSLRVVPHVKVSDSRPLCKHNDQIDSNNLLLRAEQPGCKKLRPMRMRATLAITEVTC